MGTKREDFEESTKIKSSAEISEMLRTAGVEAEPHSDFDQDQHTQVGNISELIAQSKAMGERPVAARSSSNIIRRTTTPIAIERVAIGSQSDIPAKTDDEAFEEMLGADARVEEKTAEVDPPADADIVELDAVADDADDAEPVEVEAEAESLDEPPLPAPLRPMELVVRPMPLPLPQAPKTTWRWGAIAWVALLLATIGLGTAGYMKISQLEDELAVTRAQLTK